MQSVTSNAVAEALSYSADEKEVGFYYGSKLYSKSFTVDVSGSSAGQAVGYTLPNEFDNYIIVRIKSTFSRNNFLAMGTLTNAWMTSRTNLYVNQSLTNNPSSMSVVVDVYYVKA